MNDKPYTIQMLELVSKPKDYKFTPEEREWIKKDMPKSSFLVKYVFYKKKSKDNTYVGLVVDGMPRDRRKSMVANTWEEICSRPLSDEEYEIAVSNYGCDKTRYTVYWYRYIEKLINDDFGLGVETPQQYIDECIKRGYSDPKIQLRKPVEYEQQLILFT